ncbi:MAG: ABC transporter permease [Blastocatellia bacterium]
MIETLLQDLRYAIRMLRRNPGYAIVAIVILAVGIGTNTAVFSVVDAVLFRALPIRDPGRLLVVWETNPRASYGPTEGNEVAPANLFDWKNRNEVFQDLTALGYINLNLTGAGEPEQIQSALVSPNFFTVVGADPMLGRSFLDEEQQSGKNRVAVLSYSLWKNNLGGGQNVLNRTIALNGIAFTVVGVMPADFELQFPSTRHVELWIPRIDDPQQHQDRDSHYLYVLGRLKPGVSLENAKSNMSTIALQLMQEYPASNRDRGVKLVPVREYLVGKTRPALLVLLGAVVFVLLIACANVAHLLLARASSRQRETAVRIALGASRFRLIRQLLTESVFLAIAGGLLGVLLAYATIEVIVKTGPADIPRLNEVGLSGLALGFTALISALTGLIFGIAPAIQCSSLALTESLKDGGVGATAGPQGNRLRGTLITTEVALSCVLVIGGCLLVRSFVRLMGEPTGFNRSGVLTFWISPPRSKYPGPEQLGSFYRDILSHLASIQGVQAVGASSQLPLSGSNETNGFSIEGRPADSKAEDEADYRVVSPGYFSAMGVPVLKGRDFTEADTDASIPVVMINRAFARRVFPSQDPIGQRITISDDRPGWRQIVGIVGDVRHFSLGKEPEPEFYVPYAQNPYRTMAFAIRAARTGRQLGKMVGEVRSEVQSVDKNLPIFKVKSMERVVSESVARERFNAILLGLLAGTALLLAGAGLYGVMSYLATQRMHEIGVRMALGAGRRDIVKMVVGQGLAMTLGGIAVGLVGAFGLTRMLSGLLYDVRTTDLLTFVSVPVVLLCVAITAAYIVAHKSATADPLNALRCE